MHQTMSQAKEEEPFCWSFPEGKAVLFPMIVAAIAFGLSIVVNTSCYLIEVALSCPSGFVCDFSDTGTNPTNDPGSYGSRLLEDASERSLAVDIDVDINIGLWSFSSEDVYRLSGTLEGIKFEACVDYSEIDGTIESLDLIDAPFKAARAGAILASIIGGIAALSLWINTCIPFSQAIRTTLCVVMSFCFVFQGMVYLLLLSNWCNEDKWVPFDVTCKPLWGAYSAAGSCLMLIFGAISVMLVHRFGYDAQPQTSVYPGQQQQMFGPPMQKSVVNIPPPQQMYPPPVPLEEPFEEPLEETFEEPFEHEEGEEEYQLDSGVVPDGDSAIVSNGNGDAPRPDKTVTKQIKADGTTVVTTRSMREDGLGYDVTTETTLPDGSKAVEVDTEAA